MPIGGVASEIQHIGVVFMDRWPRSFHAASYALCQLILLLRSLVVPPSSKFMMVRGCRHPVESKTEMILISLS